LHKDKASRKAMKVGSFLHKYNSPVELAAMRSQKHKTEEVSTEKKKD